MRKLKPMSLTDNYLKCVGETREVRELSLFLQSVTGCQPYRVRQWLEGKQMPSKDNMLAISDASGVDIETLFPKDKCFCPSCKAHRDIINELMKFRRSDTVAVFCDLTHPKDDPLLNVLKTKDISVGTIGWNDNKTASTVIVRGLRDNVIKTLVDNRNALCAYL